MNIVFLSRYGDYRYGDVAEVPDHIGEALCDSVAANGLPVAKRATAPAESLDELTVGELKKRLRVLGLSVAGSKAALVERLRGAQ